MSTRPTPTHSRPQSRRESFPGKLSTPIVTLRSNTDPVPPSLSKPLPVPAVNIIPPPPLSHASGKADPATYTWNEYATTATELDLDHIYRSHHKHIRSMSTSSYATQYTQRTQSTQAIPTRTLSQSAVVQKPATHRRRLSNLNPNAAGRGTGATTPIKFLKRTILGDRSSKNVNSEEYQELESQITENGTGFQYAATPSFAELELGLNELKRPEIRPRHRPLMAPIQPSQLTLPALRPRLNPSPVPPGTMKPKQKRKLRFMESFRKVEEIARKLGTLLTAKSQVGSATCCPLATSFRVKCRRLTASARSPSVRRRSGGNAPSTEKLSRFKSRSLRSRSGRSREKDEVEEIGGTRDKNINGVDWESEEKVILIKNNRKGCCVFIVTTSPTNPAQKYEFPIPLQHLKTQLFVHSRTLVRALDEWNKHYQSPPPHWVINFVPKAYLRRGWHLAEAVTQYLRTYGLNLDDGEPRDDGGSPRRRIGGPWRVEYEAIGYKACLVGEGGKNYQGERWGMSPAAPPAQPIADLLVPGDNNNNTSRERHPSRVWERKEESDNNQGDRGLVVGIAL